MSVLDFGDPARSVDLVFLHANGFNALTYRTILEPLSNDARILAMDQRGHGATSLRTEAEGRRNWNDFRDDLLALLARLCLRDVVLAGHSLGGAVSLFAAAEARDRVRHLVLLDPVIQPPQLAVEGSRTPSALSTGALKRREVYPDRAAATAAYRGRGAFKTWPDDMLADYVESGFVDLPDGRATLACSPRWEASNFAAQDNDPWNAFERSACPIRILRAEKESACFVESRRDRLTADGRVSIEMIEGTTHFLPMERPKLCRDVLIQAITGG
jgi:pimeloyl-ACP methyl ester carboxylesterase